MTPPAYYVKADGTICMTWDVFRAASAHDIVKILHTGRRVTPAHKSLKEQRELTVTTFVGNARPEWHPSVKASDYVPVSNSLQR